MFGIKKRRGNDGSNSSRRNPTRICGSLNIESLEDRQLMAADISLDFEIVDYVLQAEGSGCFTNILATGKVIGTDGADHIALRKSITESGAPAVYARIADAETDQTHVAEYWTDWDIGLVTVSEFQPFAAEFGDQGEICGPMPKDGASSFGHTLNVEFRVLLDGKGGNDLIELNDRITWNTTTYQPYPGGTKIDFVINITDPSITEAQGGYGHDVIYGGTGDDIIRGDSGGNTIYGGDGDDHVFGEDGYDQLWGGDGVDHLYGNTGNDVIFGYSAEGGWESLLHSKDYIWGGDGNDQLFGGGKGDYINGENGADEIWGGFGDDIINGGKNSDTLHGGIGEDKVYGGAGSDFLHGGIGDDTLRGESGNDLLWGDAGEDVLRGGAGHDHLVGHAEGDESGGAEDSDWLYGEAGNDTLEGGDGDDALSGGDDDDYLTGGSGYDFLYGNGGKDVLNGEFMSGGSGADTFWFGQTVDFDSREGDKRPLLKNIEYGF